MDRCYETKACRCYACQPAVICDNHYTEVLGGGCWVCATLHSHPDREKLINQLREQLKEVTADNQEFATRLQASERKIAKVQAQLDAKIGWLDPLSK